MKFQVCSDREGGREWAGEAGLVGCMPPHTGALIKTVIMGKVTGSAKAAVKTP